MRRKHKIDTSDNLNLALFTPKTTWQLPTQFPNLSNVKDLGVDIESNDPHLTTKGPGFLRGDASVAGVSLATDDAAWYFPFNHLGGGNLPQHTVVEFLKDTLSKTSFPKIFANAPYDLEGLHSLGVKVAGKIYDVQVNEALLDEERDDGYDLNTLCKIHLGTEKDEALLREAASAYNVDPKGGLWKLPSKYVGAYAEYDAFATRKIFYKQLEKLEKEDLLQIFDLETRLIPVLFAMRLKGVPVDIEAAARLSTQLKSQEMDLRHKLFKEYGRHINDQSGPEIAKICDKLNIHYPVTQDGNPSFKGPWLEAHEHPFLKAIVEIRQIAKNKNDYVDKIIEATVKGRLHIQWKQLVSDEGGAKTGRLAAGNPPLQQFPAGKKRNGKPNPVGQAIRAILVAENDADWLKGDYSQQEPRVLVHFAELCKFFGADAAAFAYRSNPKMDFYQHMMDAAHINRRLAKDMYLGLCYGMGKDKMAEKLNKSIDESQAIIKDFNEKLPFISQLAEKCKQLASTRGYIKTLCGRKRHFNYFEPADAYQMRKQARAEGKRVDTTPRLLDKAKVMWPNKQLIRAFTHKALNALIQGSAADMMKAGLVKGFEEDGRVPYITVHDEIGGPVSGPDDAAKWQATMQTCVKCNVPINMDIKLGRSWQ